MEENIEKIRKKQRVCVCVATEHVWRSEDNLRQWSLLFILFETRSFRMPWYIVCCLLWTPRSASHLSLRALGLRMCCITRLSLVSGDSDSCPHTCVVGTLPTEVPLHLPEVSCSIYGGSIVKIVKSNKIQH